MKKLMCLFGLSIAVAGCGPSGNKPNVELIQDMMESPAYKPQEAHPERPNLGAMRVPPKGTLPQGAFEPYEPGADFTKAKNLVNPLLEEQTGEVMARGKVVYDTYCAVCHASNGGGNGLVYEKSNGQLVVPSLITDRMKGWTDGEIFHLITKGRGLMGQYASQIPKVEDRWSAINYIRSLQKSAVSKGE